MAETPQASRSGAVAAWLGLLAPAAVTVLAAFFALRRLDDFDTWWHLAAGRWIVAHGRVPTTDTLSHTVPDHPWINLQWLYDVLLYGLYRVGGADALVISAAACFVAAVWITLRTASAFVGPVVSSILGLWLVLVAEERFLIRPEMVSFVLLAVILRLLMTARNDEGRRLWWMAPVFAVWVNCHALFVVGFVVLAGFTVSAVAARTGALPREWLRASDLGAPATRRLLLAAAASTAAVFVNPFLHRGVFFPFELLSRIDGSNTAFQAIGEFRSPFSGYFTTWSIGAFQGFFFFAAALLPIAAVAGLGRSRATGTRQEARRSAAQLEKPGFDVGSALVFCALAYLSTLARRNLGLFVFGATPLVASWLAVIADRTGLVRRLRRKPGALRTEIFATAAVCAVCAVLALFVASNRYYASVGVTKELGLGVFECNFPIRAAQFAQATQLPPKLYNDLTAGGYLTWHAAVPGGVFIDGRLEVYDTEFFSRYLAAFNDMRAWQQQVDAYAASTIILFHRWGNRHALIRFLARDPQWALVYYDDAAVIFVRRQGNEDTIARAVAAFPSWDAQGRERLARPAGGWRIPLELATALESRARVLTTLGKAEAALESWQRLLALDALRPAAEASARFNVAWLLAARGERASARMQAEQAAVLDPNNVDVKRFLERLGA